jgi:Holliday junction resolvase RusA-like endonuclease
MSPIVFEILGRAQTAGSKRAFPFKRHDGSLGVRVSDDNPRSGDWKANVGWAASAARPIGQALLDGPLSVEFVFEIPRPQGHFGKRGLLSSAPACPTVRPDLLKLARSVEDAITGIIWNDDAQIVREVLVKKYGEQARLTVRIERAAETCCEWAPLPWNVGKIHMLHTATGGQDLTKSLFPLAEVAK